MGFNINDIIAHINKNYFAKPNYYTLSILGGNSHIDAPVDITFNCNAISVPGINLGITGDKRHGVGIFTNYPNGKAFTEINATFYESEFEAERKYFVEWMNKIFDPNTGKIEFYDLYTKTVIITQYNRKGQAVYEAKMLQAWPSNISALDRGYTLGDSPALITIGLQFYKLEEKFFSPTEITKNTINVRTPDINGIIWDDPMKTENTPVSAPITPVSKKPTKKPTIIV